MPKAQGTTTAEQKPKPGDAERRALVEEALGRREKLAESQVEMARLFLAHGKPEIARRRLEEVLEHYSGAAAAEEARRLLEAP